MASFQHYSGKVYPVQAGQGVFKAYPAITGSCCVDQVTVAMPDGMP